MARDAVTVTNSVRAGVLATLDVPVQANGAEMANPNGRVVFIVVNGIGGAGAGATEVTVQQVDDPYGRKENDPAFSVTADNVGLFGPFPPALYNQSDGTVQFDYDAIAANIKVFGLSVL
jgi:hypothetical protein